jgi:hypothetical protein
MAKSGKDRLLAMRLALYIKAFGDTPLPLEHRSYRNYAAALGQQYQELRVRHGSEPANKARVTARAAIRKRTLRVAAEGLVPDIPPTQPKARSKKETKTRFTIPKPKPTMSDSPLQRTEFTLSQAIEAVGPNRKDLWNCRRKLSHCDYLSALLHARRLPDRSGKFMLNIYPCVVCGGLHVGRSKFGSSRSVGRCGAIGR